MKTKQWLVVCISIMLVAGLCWAETVNVNPHKIVLNAKGASDDVQANVRIVLPGAPVVGFDVTLKFNDVPVAKAESAYYCVLDDILIIGFDRTELQDNPDVQDMANTTVTATVVGSVIVRNAAGDDTEVDFSGSDAVEIVAPGAKGK